MVEVVQLTGGKQNMIAQPRTTGGSISRRDEAVEAAAKALWATGGTDWSQASADQKEYHRDCAIAALAAALDVIAPTVLNEVNVLRDLPFNAVLRGVGDDSVFLVTITPAFSPEIASAYYESFGVTEWAVLYYPEEV